MNRPSVSLLLFSLVLVPAVQAQAEADGPDYFQIKAREAVSVYESASLDAKAVGALPAGAKGLKNLACSGFTPFDEWSRMSPEEQEEAKARVWCKVSYRGQSGWVQNIYLQEYGLPSSPSFDCAQAEGEVENIICSDPELMNFDNMMAVVYRDASKVASGLDDRPREAVKHLKASQRGWIKGRNECWKEPEDRKGCVLSSYERRISYLQAKWVLVEPSETLRFECENDREEFFVTFFETDLLPSAAVEYGDGREIFVSSPAASGAKYAGDFGRFLWLKGREAVFVWDQYQPEKICKTN